MDRQASMVVALSATAVLLAFGAFFVLREGAPNERKVLGAQSVTGLRSSAEPAVAPPLVRERLAPPASSPLVPSGRSWKRSASSVYRHLFVDPPTRPFEHRPVSSAGCGKQR
jgi:hypothetical protein